MHFRPRDREKSAICLNQGLSPLNVTEAIVGLIIIGPAIIVRRLVGHEGVPLPVPAALRVLEILLRVPELDALPAAVRVVIVVVLCVREALLGGVDQAGVVVAHLLEAAPRRGFARTVHAPARLLREGGVLAARAEAVEVEGLFFDPRLAAVVVVVAVLADVEVAWVPASDEVFLRSVAHGYGGMR